MSSTNNEEKMVKHLLELNEDTYHYSNLIFMVRCDKDGKHIDPYIRNEPNNRIVKYYKNKNFFVIYDNDIITEIIHVSTCWAGDHINYHLGPDQIAYAETEYYHGRPKHFYKECNIDLKQFIVDNEL